MSSSLYFKHFNIIYLQNVILARQVTDEHLKIKMNKLI